MYDRNPPWNPGQPSGHGCVPVVGPRNGSDKNYNIRPHASKSSKPIIEGLQSIFAADYIYLGIVFAVGVKILL